ncbi:MULTISPECIES: helix-turn-helix domain-containing protein [Flavobacterium]|uniref:helix-turn-helix domain-containing protein n=1 Tax=Flavobacterium TaxID=237 RepID=UPI001FCA57C4|nr:MULTISPECIES: helix-turn-helix transcriptional regulator [Flavobacterium]UOK42816.1 helix-turn-helix transcriptional regulator [Flavobacterium enshiense]
MEDSQTIKNTLGLTQEEMAILLGIKRSNWSMFKSGKRDLSLNSKQQLGSLMQTVQKKKQPSKEIQKLIKKEQLDAKTKLQHEYGNMSLKLDRIEKNITIVENIRTESFAALETVAALESQKNIPHIEALIKRVHQRVILTLKKHSLSHLNELQLKKENLEMLKLKIEEKLKS